MQLSCPNCGEGIPSENINIQEMAAVCPACDTVFPFELPESKTKRRKVKRPERLTLRETDDQLQMAFRTNFRLDRSEAFLSGIIMSLVFTFTTLMLTEEFLAGDVSALLPAGFGLVTLFSYYWLALIVYNKTHIEMDAEKIRVSRRPVPSLFSQTNEVHLSGVVAIRYEETPVSKREGYDTPRHRVWAERADGSRKIIVNDVIDEYALFISQRLNDYLNLDTHLDVSSLIDDEPEIEEAPDELAQASQMDRQ